MDSYLKIEYILTEDNKYYYLESYKIPMIFLKDKYITLVDWIEEKDGWYYLYYKEQLIKKVNGKYIREVGYIGNEK